MTKHASEAKPRSKRAGAPATGVAPDVPLRKPRGKVTSSGKTSASTTAASNASAGKAAGDRTIPDRSKPDVVPEQASVGRVAPPRTPPARDGEVQRSADSGEKAYWAIRRDLVEFRVKPNERINEVHLARILGLSRTPIREALNRLASEGFVVFAPNRGFFFRGFDPDDLIDLFEYRAILETGAFALMCERATEADIGRLSAFWAEAKKRYEKRDPDEILDLDETFHLTIAELSGNPEVVRQLTALNARIRFIRRVQIEHAPLMKSLLDDHAAIVDAAGRRDVGGGVATLRSHISMTMADAQAALKEALFRVYTADQQKAPNRRPQRA